MEGGGCTPWQSLCYNFLCMGSGIYGFMGYRDGLVPHSLQSASVYSLEALYASSSAFGFEFLLWKKRLVIRN